MACISAPTAAIAGGALSGGGSIFSGILGSGAAKDASKTQADAALQAAAVSKAMFDQIRTDLGPFREGGASAFTQLRNMLQAPTTDLNSPLNLTPPIDSAFRPSLPALAATPGYQFNLQQGSKAAGNAAAAMGLGRSGAAGIGLTKYASGLAETTFQDQFGNWLNTQNLKLSGWLDSQNLNLQQKQLVYNMLSGLGNTGEAAAAQTAAAGVPLAGQQGAGITGAGAARAAGTVGSTNALTAGITGAGAAGSNAALLMALQGGGMFGQGGGGAGFNSKTFDPTTAGGDYGGGGTTS